MADDGGAAPVSRKVAVFLSNAAPRPAPARADADDGPDPRMLSHGLAAAGFAARARPLHRFPFNPLARLGTFYAGFDPLRALQVLLLDRNADVIIGIGESNIAIVVLLASLFRFKPRIVLREVPSRGWSKRDAVADFVLPRVDSVQALTPHQKAWVDSTFRLKRPSDLVGFAIDEQFFRPLGKPDGGYILAVGDDTGRDYACLVAACEPTPFRLILRTDTKPEVPAAMRHRVAVLGRMDFPTLRDLYASASVVAVPSRAVDHPSGITSLFEAMAMARAVVASDIGSSSHAVRHGVNGMLVAPGDAAAMRVAIETLMSDAALRARLGRGARETILAEFSYAGYARRFAANLDATACRAG